MPLIPDISVRNAFPRMSNFLIKHSEKDQIQILQYHRFQVKIPSMPSNPSVSDALILCTQWRQVFYHRMSLQFIHHKPQLEAHLCINTGPVMGVPLYDLIVCYVDYLLAAFKILNTEQYIYFMSIIKVQF